MRRPSVEEIKSVLSSGAYRNFAVEIIEYKDYWKLEVSQMYEYVRCGIDEILALCKLFETEDISVGEQSHYDGCETCDYGSSYTVNFIIKDKPLSVEMLTWINRRHSRRHNDRLRRND